MADKKNRLKPEGSRIYSYWSALYMTFYSKRLYVDIGKRWKGFGILYLLLVFSILVIPIAIKMSINFRKDFEQQVTEPLTQVPDLYIQNGMLSFDKPMPYLIKNKQGRVVIIIDTTGAVDNFYTNKYPDLSILINKEQIGMRLPNPQLLGSVPASKNKPVVQSYGENANYMFNAKQFTENPFFAKILLTSELAIYPIVLGIFYAIFTVIFLTIAFMGQIFSSVFFAFSITLKQSSRFVMTASTPMMLLFSILFSLNYAFNGVGIFLMAVFALYYSFAVRSLKSESMWIAKA